MLTGKCKTRANFDRLVSNKIFWNATFLLVAAKTFPFGEFAFKFSVEKYELISSSERLQTHGVGEMRDSASGFFTLESPPSRNVAAYSFRVDQGLACPAHPWYLGVTLPAFFCGRAHLLQQRSL